MKSKSKKIFLGFFLFTLLGLYANASAKVDSSKNLPKNAKANSPKVAKIADNKANIYALVDRIAEPHGFSTTIKTIIYLESRNGLYPINLNDPACGITHINLNTYMRRHKLKDTPFNRNKACADLINSQEWAILNALQELLFWQKVHCASGDCTTAQFKNVVKSYNTGWNYKGKKAKEYWNRFKKSYIELYPKARKRITK